VIALDLEGLRGGFGLGSDGTPLEPVGGYLARSGNPETVLVGIGATR